MSATDQFPQTQTNKNSEPGFQTGFFLDHFLKPKMRICIAVIFCLFSGFAYSQTFVIHPVDSAQNAVVIDKNGNPVDTSVKENTAAEKAAIKAAFDSLNCNCSNAAKHSGKMYEDGMLVLFRGKKISKKGCFVQKKLICGIECVYDANGNLVRIIKIQNGTSVGEYLFPK